MNFQTEFKRNIYAQMAVQFNKSKIKHAAVHGVDYLSNHYGRDIDIMIYYKDRKTARKIIYSVFEQNGIKFKDNIFLWGDWVIGYKIIEDKIFFIEVDLIYHQYYRCFELTSDQGLSTNKEHTDCFHIDYWNMYAKVVLIKFLGLDFCKLSDKKLKEVTRIVKLYAHHIHSTSFFDKELIENLNQAILINDIERISELRSKMKVFKIIKKNPLTSFVIFLKMSSYVFQRKIKSSGVIPVTLLSNKATLNVKEIIELQNESFFSKVNIIDEVLSVLSIEHLLKTYINLRKKWEPITLNIVILSDKTLKTILTNSFIRFIFRFFNILVIDTNKENYQTKDILIKILEQTVKK
jgi:hypothetical protein